MPENTKNRTPETAQPYAEATLTLWDGVWDTGVVRVPCEVYSRIVGYLRPVQNWNDGKRAEFKERVAFDIERGVIG